MERRPGHSSQAVERRVSSAADIGGHSEKPLPRGSRRTGRQRAHRLGYAVELHDPLSGSLRKHGCRPRQVEPPLRTGCASADCPL